MAKTESVAVQMEKILDEYDEKVQRVTNNAIDSVSKESVQKLKNTSPKRTGAYGGAYARSWGTKKERGNGKIKTVIVRNKDHYQLTHLLENGHVVRNAKGTFGRAPGIKHIKPVEDWANSGLPQEIERELE